MPIPVITDIETDIHCSPFRIMICSPPSIWILNFRLMWNPVFFFATEAELRLGRPRPPSSLRSSIGQLGIGDLLESSGLKTHRDKRYTSVFSVSSVVEKPYTNSLSKE